MNGDRSLGFVRASALYDPCEQTRTDDAPALRRYWKRDAGRVDR